MTPVGILCAVAWAEGILAVCALGVAHRAWHEAGRQRRIAAFWSDRAAHWESEAGKVAAIGIKRGPRGRFRRAA